VDRAARLCVESRLQNSGQTCIAAKRFIVHESLYEDFKTLVIKFCEEKKYGDPLSEKTEIGPLSSLKLAEELRLQVKKTVEAGAALVYEKKTEGLPKTFFPVTILENLPLSSPAYNEELFGPVFSLFKFKDLDEACALANDSEFGLGAAVFSKNIENGEKIVEHKIEAGSCAVNSYVKSDFEMPFGGVKNSGVGRELAAYGMHEFVNIKSLVVCS